MTTYSWKSAVSGSWNTPTSWTMANVTPGSATVPAAASNGVSLDTVNFATGSATAYTVTGTAHAHILDIPDKVTFNNFSLSNYYAGVDINLAAGANVTVGAGSSFDLSYLYLDGGSGGISVAANSNLTVNGTIANGTVTIAGTVTISTGPPCVDSVSRGVPPPGRDWYLHGRCQRLK